MIIAYQPNVLWNGQFDAGGVKIGTEDSWTLNTPKEDNWGMKAQKHRLL